MVTSFNSNWFFHTSDYRLELDQSLRNTGAFGSTGVQRLWHAAADENAENKGE